MHPALKHILFKGVGETYDPAATALFARFTTPPTAARKRVINTLIAALKAAGIWNKLTALWVVAAADSQAALLNWKSTSFNLGEVNSPTFTADRGYTGVFGNSLDPGVGKRLTTNLVPSADIALDDNSMGVWYRTVAVNDGYDVAYDSTNLWGVGLNVSGTASAGYNNTGALGPEWSGSSPTPGLLSMSRGSSTLTTLYKNGASVATSALASVGRPTTQLTFLGYLSNSTYYCHAHQESAMFVATHLTAGEMASLHSALTAYMTDVGA